MVVEPLLTLVSILLSCSLKVGTGKCTDAKAQGWTMTGGVLSNGDMCVGREGTKAVLKPCQEGSEVMAIVAQDSTGNDAFSFSSLAF